MARKPEFDRDEVIERAMKLFWARGYQGASISALSAATGLKPGSLYAAFGSKDGLFREALERYVTGVREVAYRLEAGPRALLDGWFAAHIRNAVENDGRGCLLLNSAAEAPALDRLGRELVDIQLDTLEKLFRRCVTDARRQHPRPGAPAPAATARMLVTALAGISALSRAGVGKRALQDAARAALSLV